MIVIDEYEFFRTPENNLLLATASFERENDRDSFIEGLSKNGFTIRRQDGEEIHLKVIGAEIGTSIIDQENLLIEIDNSLNEDELR